MNIKYLNMIFLSILINGDINIREVVEAMWMLMMCLWILL
mgnify:CR=1 FL=1